MFLIFGYARHIVRSHAKTVNLAYLLYDNLKDCLIRRLPLDETLTGITGQTVVSGEAAYHIYSSSRMIGGTRYYLISIRPIPETGTVKAFVSRFFFVFYLILGLLFIGLAWMLSRYISKPLVQLSDITQKLAALDFKERAQFQSSDEFGMLSANINTMADNLERSITELQNATEKAMENEKRIQRILDDLAHEFKTPLFIVSSYTEALEADLPGVDKEKYYAIIDAEINKLSDMVSEVLELSALRSGRRKIEIGVYDLQETIEAIVETFDKHFREGGFTVSVDVPEVNVYMDARQIERVLTNFFTNALKYSTGRKQIDIHTETGSADSIFVYVGNTGQLNEEDRERIWERYYSSGSSGETRMLSEGIGLDIVRAILQGHKSEHGVEQREDMVYFYFSLALAPQD